MKQTKALEYEAQAAAFYPYFMDYLVRRATAVGSIEEALSLEGINSLPAIYQLGGVYKAVNVPLKLLTANVDNAVATLEAAANSAEVAAANADAAAKRVTDAITDIEAEKLAAIAATETAEVVTANTEAARIECAAVTEEARAVVLACGISKENCDIATAENIAATTACREATTACREATADNIEATETSLALAEELRAHPNKVSAANTWMVWNAVTHEYEDTHKDASGGPELTMEAMKAAYPLLEKMVTNFGHYRSADSPHPKNALVMFAGKRHISLAETGDAPVNVYTDEEGRRYLLDEGVYALAGTPSPDWELLVPETEEVAEAKATEVAGEIAAQVAVEVADRQAATTATSVATKVATEVATEVGTQVATEVTGEMTT